MDETAQGRARRTAWEVKIGLSVIGVLLVVFVVTAYRRFAPHPTTPPATTVSVSKIDDASLAKPTAQATLQTPKVLRHGPDDVGAPPARASTARNIAPDTSPMSELQPPLASSVNIEDAGQPALFHSGGGSFAPQPLKSDIPLVRATPTKPAEHTKLIRPLSAERPIQASESPEPTAVIQRDDSLWLISQRVYGSGVYFRALYEHNKTTFPNPDDLPAGGKLKTPDVNQLRNLYPDLCPESRGNSMSASEQRPTGDSTPRVYSVKSGDTLFDIARYELGQASRYIELIEMNRGRLPSNIDHLQPLPRGLELRLPENSR